MGDYRLFLSNGLTHVGHDEREETADLIEAVNEGDQTPDLPLGWIWIADLYVRSAAVIALEVVPVEIAP